MGKMKLNIKALKDDTDMLMIMSEKIFETLKHSKIFISDDGVSTNAGTTDDSAISYRDSVVISALIFNALLLIANKWDSLDNECREFIENNLEIIVNFMKGK